MPRSSKGPVVERLKLRRIRIRGFKALAGFDLRIPGDLLVLIGANGSGKSSVLQALAFLRSLAGGNPAGFFNDRGWTPSEIRTHRGKMLPIRGIDFSIFLEGETGSRIYWRLIWDTVKQNLNNEEIMIFPHGAAAPKPVLVRSKIGVWTTGGKDVAAIQPEGSLIPLLDLDAIDQETGRILASLHAWGTGIFSLELLSPTAMRRGTRGSASDIGPRGERLGGFLASLTPAQKDRLVARLQLFYPIADLETIRKRAGWVDLRIAEGFSGTPRIGAAHMSDGFMRLLGLAAIPEFGDDASTILLDEVEDGIDPHILPTLIELIARESRSQLILTSHSPVLVNQFGPDQIAFVARRDDGQAVAASYREMKPLMDGLTYFGPGEMWNNTNTETISRMVQEANDATKAKYSALTVPTIMKFMENI